MSQSTVCHIKLSQQAGLTLIELLLSLTLSLLLVLLLSFISVATKHQQEVFNSLSLLHKHARFALQRLHAELEMAGFIGCPQLDADFPLNNNSAYPFYANKQVELGQDQLHSALVTIRHRSVEAAVLQKQRSESSVLELSTDLAFAPGEVLIISDCKHADIFQVEKQFKEKNRQIIITRQPLRYHYGIEAEVGSLEINSYSVEKTKRRDPRGEAIFALYWTDRSGRKRELVEGIQQLKIRFHQVRNHTGLSIELKARQKALTKTEYDFVILRNQSA
ncbi:MAG TPA: hypothetical protein VLH77_06805 [Gammaproteobacteria bacterium]|nr:hypothetical protein [Gammaproteobacteria bacterium]